VWRAVMDPRRAPRECRAVALAGVVRWSGVLLPLRIAPGRGRPVWHPPPGWPDGWLEARTMLCAAHSLWPVGVSERLGNRRVHDPGALARLEWRPGEDPDGLATLLADLADLAARNRPRARAARVTRPLE